MKHTLLMALFLGANAAIAQTLIWHDVEDTSGGRLSALNALADVSRSPQGTASTQGRACIQKANRVAIRELATGTVLAEVALPPLTGLVAPTVTFSQKWVDADNGWEALIMYFDTTGGAMRYRFRLLDGGEILLEDAGYPMLYLLEGKTVLYSGHVTSQKKAWRFREGIASALPKSTARSAGPAASWSPHGGMYKLVIDRVGDGNLGLFDLTGRRILSVPITPVGNGKRVYYLNTQSMADGVYPAAIKTGDSRDGRSLLKVESGAQP